jgi:hypothetical protein
MYDHTRMASSSDGRHSPVCVSIAHCVTVTRHTVHALESKRCTFRVHDFIPTTDTHTTSVFLAQDSRVGLSELIIGKCFRPLMVMDLQQEHK